MKLIRKPYYVDTSYNLVGRRMIGPKIWAPQNEAERTFEKLRTGKDIAFDIGMQFAMLEFNDEQVTLYDVQVVESFGDDTFRCTCGHFNDWSE